jgi:signal transduction histidine kinase
VRAWQHAWHLERPRWSYKHGIPLFLTQLATTLHSKLVEPDSIASTASRHGGELLKMGFTVAQVVHDYGDVCQTITQLAIERGTDISTREFQALNLALDEAIAEAVTEFGRQREVAIASAGTRRATEDLAVLAHELRNLLATSILAYDMLKTGSLGITGNTGSLLGRNLLALRNLVDRSLASVRLDAGIGNTERIRLQELIEEAEISALMEAKARGHRLKTELDNGRAVVVSDRQILASIVANLVQNALKYTRPNTEVILRTITTADRVRIEVEDECGGLPPGSADHLFEAYKQASADHSGLGLGLAICQRGAAAIGAAMTVRDMPGKGCVFCVELARAKV